MIRRTLVGLAFAGLTLAGCTKTVVQDRPVRVAVPVTAPCATARPTPPIPLSQRTDWDTLDARQKAALVGKQAVELRTYSEKLNAATIACP